MAYALGPVKPWVKSAADTMGPMFGITTIYGVAARAGESEHPLGLALDFMVYGDKAKGQALANYAQANAGALNIYYIIWQQHIWDIQRASEGWRLMEDRGSATANHMDHVHISFNSTEGGGANPTADPAGFHIPDPLGIGGAIGGAAGAAGDAADAIGKVGAVFAWLTDTHNWVRIGFVILGFSLIVLGVVKVGGGAAQSVQDAAKAAGKVVQ